VVVVCQARNTDVFSSTLLHRKNPGYIVSNARMITALERVCRGLFEILTRHLPVEGGGAQEDHRTSHRANSGNVLDHVLGCLQPVK
jgi:hypothetical protein